MTMDIAENALSDPAPQQVRAACGGTNGGEMSLDGFLATSGSNHPSNRTAYGAALPPLSRELQSIASPAPKGVRLISPPLDRLLLPCHNFLKESPGSFTDSHPFKG
ncbi:MAG: hypothetical protein V1766_00150 [Pseudomonadota bacterium]